jgi:hypothetical protein
MEVFTREVQFPPRLATKGHAMKVLGIVVVCAMTLYVVDSLYFDGLYFSAVRELLGMAANR